MNKIQMAMSRIGARVFRNQVGLFTASDGSIVRTGLGTGSSDLIGWTTIQVSPRMVGKRVAVFTAIEVKTAKGKVSDKQENFIEVVKRSGGIAFVARSTDEAVENIMKERKIGNGVGL